MSTSTGVRRGALKKQQRVGRAAVVSPRVQVAEMQRTRLLTAAAVSIAELGYTRTSVAHITRGRGCHGKTFYDLFDNREECLIAVMEDAVERMTPRDRGGWFVRACVA